MGKLLDAIRNAGSALAEVERARRELERERRQPVDLGERVTREQFGERWPLDVDEGYLRCEGIGAVIFHVGGMDYAVNGLARSMHPRMQDIEPIWLRHPEYPELRVNIGPLIDYGLSLGS